MAQANSAAAAAVATPVLGAIYPQHQVAAVAAAGLQAHTALAALPVAGAIHVPIPVPMQLPMGVVGTLSAPVSAATAALVLQAQAAQQVCSLCSIKRIKNKLLFPLRLFYK